MWTKKYRNSLISLVYQKLINTYDPDNFLLITEEFWLDDGYSSLDKKVELNLKKDLKNIHSKYLESISRLEKYLQNWNKTYPLSQAVLLTFLYEVDMLKEGFTEQRTALINKYVKFCQSYIDRQNASLIHAILVKL